MAEPHWGMLKKFIALWRWLNTDSSPPLDVPYWLIHQHESNDGVYRNWPDEECREAHLPGDCIRCGADDV